MVGYIPKYTERGKVFQKQKKASFFKNKKEWVNKRKPKKLEQIKKGIFKKRKLNFSRKLLLVRRNKLRKLYFKILIMTLELKLNYHLKIPILTKLINVFDLCSVNKGYGKLFPYFKSVAKRNPVRHRHYFKELCFGFFCGFALKNPKLISYFIAKCMRETRKHYVFLRILDFFLIKSRSHFGTSSVKIELKGKLNGKPRTKLVRINHGKPVATSTYGTNVRYCFSTVFTYTGVFGLRIWIFV